MEAEFFKPLAIQVTVQLTKTVRCLSKYEIRMLNGVTISLYICSFAVGSKWLLQSKNHVFVNTDYVIVIDGAAYMS